VSLAELISVARGDTPADLLLQNARIVNTLVGIIEEGNVAIYGDRIAGIGNYHQARETIDLRGSYLAPGLINGHTHIESSMLHPVQYAQAVVPRGTSAIVTDLHEIANVAGLDGIQFVMNWAHKLDLDMFFMAPSCVPATHMETSGAEIGARDIKKAFRWQSVIGLGEVMNFPGVVSGNEQVLNKIEAVQGRVIDGHAPGVTGKNLNAYVAAGISSDHETTSLEEGREKLRRGMYLMIREGSSEKNLDTLLPLVNDRMYRRCLLVVDDRSCSDLLREGDIDAVVRKAIQKGLEPVRAIQLATINAAEHFRLYNRGAIAPGYMANLMTITDLAHLEIEMVFHKGKLVAREGRHLRPLPETPARELANTVRIKPFAMEALKLRARGESCSVIEIVPGQIVTRKRVERIGAVNGEINPQIGEDLLKLAVVERHKSNGNIGLGLVKGFGLKRGALASSIAHDSHNVIAVGTNDLDLFTAIKEVERLQGGLAVCCDGKVLEALPLPIAGLLSSEPLEAVVEKFERLEMVTAGLGNVPAAPFALLSFLALPVIPELRLTDLGLVDVVEFKLI